MSFQKQRGEWADAKYKATLCGLRTLSRLKHLHDKGEYYAHIKRLGRDIKLYIRKKTWIIPDTP